MPDDISDDKTKASVALGAIVERVRPASIVDKKQVITDFDILSNRSNYVSVCREFDLKSLYLTK